MITGIEDQLRRDEGYRNKPYQDAVGRLTIGYGRNLSDDGIRSDEAALMLRNDISNAQMQVSTYIPWALDLDEARRGVLVNMAFNMGIRGLLGFSHMLEKLKSHDYDGASAEMLNSHWAQQVGSRSIRLSVQLKTGLWQ